MHYYKAHVQYDGTGLAGFQWQKDATTVQSEINKAMATFVKTKFSTLGASRTDSGVHAHHQIVKLTVEEEISPDEFLVELQKNLPPQIRCLSIEKCAGSFNPSVQAQKKEYRYLFTNQRKHPIQECDFVANISFEINIDLMKQCLPFFLGKHDFQNFVSMGSNVKTTERTIELIELDLINPHSLFQSQAPFHIPEELTECYQVRIVADGFLKQMIRHLMSALWMVASAKMSPKQLNELVDGPRQTQQLWRLATPKGLHLYRIYY